MVYFPTCTIISIQTRKYKYTIHGWYGNTPHPNTSVISPSQQCQWLPWILATLPCLPNKITAGNRDWDGKKKHLTKHVQYCSWWKIQKFGISYHFFCWKLTFEPQKKSFPCIYTLLQTWHLPVSGRLVFGKMSFFHRNIGQKNPPQVRNTCRRRVRSLGAVEKIPTQPNTISSYKEGPKTPSYPFIGAKNNSNL